MKIRLPSWLQIGLGFLAGLFTAWKQQRDETIKNEKTVEQERGDAAALDDAELKGEVKRWTKP